MKKDRKQAEESGSGVPGWIVSFSDMITLLLAFFVLLQSFAKPRQNLMEAGQGSFRRAIQSLGLPAWMRGRSKQRNMDHIRPRNPMEEGKKLPDRRIIDAEDEKIRAFFERARKELESETVDPKQAVRDVIATDVRFTPGSWQLDDAAKEILDKSVGGIMGMEPERNICVYVIGLAGDVSEQQDQIILSAKRASQVQQYLRSHLHSYIVGGNWSVFSWGEGGGGPWSRTRRIDSKRTSIVLVAVEVGD